MPTIIRHLRAGEERVFLEIHGRAVRGLAASHYGPDVLDAWTVPPNEQNLVKFIENADNEIRLVAERDSELVGLGAIVLEKSELRACYVVPEAARSGVGTALVREMERIAVGNGLAHLELLGSLNAEPFYRSLGYRSQEHTTFMIRPGQPMAAVRMSKKLDA